MNNAGSYTELVRLTSLRTVAVPSIICRAIKPGFNLANIHPLPYFVFVSGHLFFCYLFLVGSCFTMPQ
jgi:hypothetical protein